MMLQSIAPVRDSAMENISEVDRGGIVFLRDGATKVGYCNTPEL